MAWLQWTWIFLRNGMSWCGKRSLSSWNHHLCNPALHFWIYQINRLHDFFCIPKSYTEKGRDAGRWARACVIMTGVMFGTSIIWGIVLPSASTGCRGTRWRTSGIRSRWGCCGAVALIKRGQEGTNATGLVEKWWRNDTIPNNVVQR